jgi:gamma-glutamyltranspeptidase/glutathione hydrolase
MSSWGVATPHRTASEEAAGVLARGGNAVDAAVAAAIALTVLYPNQCSAGGDVIALVGTAEGVYAVDDSGRAPQGADAAGLAATSRLMPTYGPHPVTVPGAVAAWFELAALWGSLPVAGALRRAADLAADGVPVAPGLARDIAREAARLRADPGLREVFLPGGELLGAGDALVQPRLAGTLRRIADDGPDAFYTGEVAEGIVATLHEQGSPIALSDLAGHRTTIGRPVAATYSGVEYLSAPPPSQGAFFLQGLAALEVVRRQEGRELDPLGDDAALVVRIMDAAARDRDLMLGDPSYAPLDVQKLCSERAGEIAADALAGRPLPLPNTALRPSGDTVAVVTADGRGNWVTLMQSNFHAFGSGILDPRSGVLLHNRGASFELDPDSVNRFAPGRRPAHTLMPVLLRSDGRLVGAHGAMGGRAQPQIHAQVALNLAAGAAPDAAVALPRWVLTPPEPGCRAAGRPTVAVEQDLPARADLERQFDVVTLPRHDDEVGHAQVVRSSAAGIVAASDPRADGAALMG